MNFQKEMIEIREKRFETEDEAQAEADEMNEHTMGPTFCPMIQKQCRTDCECFAPARVGQQIYSHQVSSIGKKKQFKVEGFYCDNAMFSGNSYNYS